MDALVDRILERAVAVLPPRCTLCGGAGQPPALDLCAACEADLRGFDRACLRCGAPGSAAYADTGCDECRARPPPYARCFAACDYAPPVDALVHALKYRGHLAVARVLGTVLARRVAELGLHLDVDAVLAVPLHPARHAERGFNQSAEIARHVARALSLPLEPRLVMRTGDTRPQVGLPAVERQANVAGAFRTAAAGIAGRRLVIVDDVVTTGSTVAELARCLYRSGAATVDVWCVARAQAQRNV
jgi:ComF family protein